MIFKTKVIVIVITVIILFGVFSFSHFYNNSNLDWYNYYGAQYEGFYSAGNMTNNESNFNRLVEELVQDGFVIDYSQEHFTEYNPNQNSTIKFNQSHETSLITGFAEIGNNTITLYMSFHRNNPITIDENQNFNESTANHFENDSLTLDSYISEVSTVIESIYHVNLTYESFQRIYDGPYST